MDPVRRQIALAKAEKIFEEAQEAKSRALAGLEKMQSEVLRRHLTGPGSLPRFVRHFWSVIEPDMPLVWNWHLDELCQCIELAVRSGKHPRWIFNIPPGTLKSILVSVMVRAWLWAENPALRFLSASYSSHLSVRDNIKLRTIVLSPEYKKIFRKFSLTGDQNAKERFDTLKGGWSIATSVGGVGTGEHPDYIFIDDPITEAQSRSEAERNEANSWLDRTISSRGVVRGVRTFLVMQRLHTDDPAGHLRAKGGWDSVIFPMRYEPFRAPNGSDPGHTPDPRDRRSIPNELLFPALFDEVKVRALEIALGPFAAAGQLQQRPVPEGGGLFRREWFRVVDVGPGHNATRRVRGWDTAGTEGDGDYTAGVRISEADDTFFVEHAVAVQIGPGFVDDLIKNTATMDGKDCTIREEKEVGSAGLAVIGARTKLLKGYDYAGVPISGDKVTRAKPFRAQCEGGHVVLIRGDWNERYLDELCAFPVGKHDDLVDATSCSFNALLLEPPRKVMTAVW